MLRGEIDLDRFEELIRRSQAVVQRRQLSVNDRRYWKLFNRLLDEGEVLGYNPCIEHEVNWTDENDE